MFYDGLDDILRLLVMAPLAYITLVALLRLSGKRTLAKMNAFDLVITVSLGSTLASVVLSTDVSFSEGALAFGLLIGLQYVVAWSAQRFDVVQQVVKSDPRLLAYRGEMLPAALRDERVVEAEVLAAIRGAGYAGLNDVAAVVLETDGSFSVVADGADNEQLRALRKVPAL
jgi:uncharacterized membrane protein YcaP (DUF421 family)